MLTTNTYSVTLMISFSLVQKYVEYLSYLKRFYHTNICFICLRSTIDAQAPEANEDVVPVCDVNSHQNSIVAPILILLILLLANVNNSHYVYYHGYYV